MSFVLCAIWKLAVSETGNGKEGNLRKIKIASLY
jgi:hypothetical protein